MSELSANYVRETKETKIEVYLKVCGQRKVEVKTGLGYVDHMLTLLGFWGGFDLTLKAQGDIEVDAHHTLEDIGLCLGEVISRVAEDKSGLARVGWAKVPMDESLSEVVVDLSGRPYLVYREEILPVVIFGQEKDVWREFFKSLAFRSKMNLHISYCYGQNGHHLIESACKGLGLCLQQAFRLLGDEVLSTKGRID